MEELTRGVGGIGDIAARGMPVGIDAKTEGLVGFGFVSVERTILTFDLGPLTIMSQQGGTMRATDVEAHVGGVAAVETVAVDAALELGIFNQRTLVERREVAFVDTHFAPYLVARCYQAVAETVVDTVGADVEDEGTVGVPAVVVFGGNGDGERVAWILSE